MGKDGMFEIRCGLTILLVLFLFGNNLFATETNEYVATLHGVVPDGKTLNTKTIQSLIDQASQQGGGTIVFPKGRYLTGSLEMKSNVGLYLAKGAVLLGSTNPYDYVKPSAPHTPQSPKTDDNSELGLIMAIGAQQITLSGTGTIDGQGLQLALNADSLHRTGKLIDNHYNTRRMRPSELVRPKLFRFLNCKQIRVTGLTLTNSASWGLSFDLCEQLELDGLNIINRAYWNNDGIDVTDCRHVRITNCHVNAADDGICLKSYHPDSTNDSVYIANCTIRSSASAVKFGTGSYGGFRHITIEHIKVFDTFRSAIAIESVDGAVIENIRINHIVAKNTGNALFIRLGHRDGAQPGIVRHIHVNHMQVVVPFGRPDADYDLRGPEVDFFHNPFPASIVGIPDHCIEDVTLENITITYPGRGTKGMAHIPLSDLDRVPEKITDYPEFSMFGELPSWGFYVRHANGLQMRNVRLRLKKPDFRPAYVLDDVDNVELAQISIVGKPTSPQLVLRQVEHIKIENSDIQPVTTTQLFPHIKTR